jgi:hypothetical protein
MRQLGGTIKEALDIDFLSTGDDNLEPRSACGRVCQGLQDAWTTLRAAALIKCVNDKDESLFRDSRKFADEVKEESGLH